ncbi:hypothetical protein EZ315_09875 [Duncaniella freteri]|uniref:Uncharacterized protein n=1 Tax=Duncaniella freteri TaxID=2530391 RepID=A0A4Z0V0G8_9BACT|nr:hypothetical protein [Duncaniella freteri]TGG36184.1 hypothetical protein EZ315_09875 [Duncaniella freteri]
MSARQVGELFCGLIEACDDINAAVSLFLSVNLPEILADIDKRLAGADTAAADTRAELQKSEAARARIDSLISQLSGQSLAAPLRVDIISAPRTVTLANPVRQQIRARLFPSFGLALSSAWATTKPSTFRPTASSPPARLGRSYVNAVATSDTSVYKTLCIDVVPPRCRLTASGALRLDGKGNLRLT